jgi:hypothetical protein
LISRPLPRRGRAAPAVEAAIVPPAETASDEVEILAVLSDAVARGLILRARGRDVSPREFVETFGLDDARGVARDWRDLDRVFGPGGSGAPLALSRPGPYLRDARSEGGPS